MDGREKMDTSVIKSDVSRAEMLGMMVFYSARSAWDFMVDDPHMRCALMGTPVFTTEKCRLYCQSGSKTCLTCSKRPALRTIQQLKEETMPSVKGICEGCGKERTLLAKKKCWACNGYGQSKTKKPEAATQKAPLPKGVELSPPKIRAKKGNPLEPADTNARNALLQKENITFPGVKGLVGAGDGPTVTFRTDVDNELFNRIAARAKKNRREVGDEILVLAERSLDNNVAADGGTIEIAYIDKLIERMKKYPVPAANNFEELYRITLDLVRARMWEMAE